MDIQEQAAISLSPPERNELAQHEVIIERGLKTFAEVAHALLAIRDNRLYREQYGTFEEYCQERWGFTRRHSNRLIAAVEVVENLGPTGTEIFSERHLRPLVKLHPDTQREVWARAVETAPNGKVTANHVQNIVNEYEQQAEGYAEDEAGYNWTEPEPTPEPDTMGVHYSSDRHDWETPPELFSLINAEFKFTLDVCATPQTAKCLAFFTPEDDGLQQSWAGNTCWMNPPYGDEIGKWMTKAYAEGRRTTVVCLVPARVDTGWWWDNAIYGEIRFLKGRVKFLQPSIEATSAPFPSAIVIFKPDIQPKTVWWDWKHDLQLQNSIA